MGWMETRKGGGARCRRKDGEHVARAGTKAALALGSLSTSGRLSEGLRVWSPRGPNPRPASSGTTSSGGLNPADKSRNGNNAHLYFHQFPPQQQNLAFPGPGNSTGRSTPARHLHGRSDRRFSGGDGSPMRRGPRRPTRPNVCTAFTVPFGSVVFRRESASSPWAYRR